MKTNEPTNLELALMTVCATATIYGLLWISMAFF